MNRFCLRAIVVLGLSLTSAAFAQVQAPSEAEQQLKAVKIDLMMLDQEVKQFDSRVDGLKAEKATYEAALARYEGDASQYEARLATFSQNAQRYGSTVSSHNANCSGTFSDAGHVNRCNQRKADLDSWKARLQQDKAGLDSQRSGLLSRQSALNSQRDRYEAGRQRYISDSESWKRRKASVEDRMRRIIADLSRFSSRSAECANIPGVEDVDLTTLNGAAEQASRCASKGFDR